MWDQPLPENLAEIQDGSLDEDVYLFGTITEDIKGTLTQWHILFVSECILGFYSPEFKKCIP